METLLACRQLSSPDYVRVGGGAGLESSGVFLQRPRPHPHDLILILITFPRPHLQIPLLGGGGWGGGAKASTCELKMAQAHKEASGWLWEGPNPKIFRGELWRAGNEQQMKCSFSADTPFLL